MLAKEDFRESGEGEIGECGCGHVKGKVAFKHPGGGEAWPDALPTAIGQGVISFCFVTGVLKADEVAKGGQSEQSQSGAPGNSQI